MSIPGGEHAWPFARQEASPAPTPLFRGARRRRVVIAPLRRRHRFRVAHLLSGSARWALQVASLLLRGRLTRASHARAVREFLERMGGLWVKTGQILALRRDFFSHEFCVELSSLQDRATGFPADAARRVLEQELGAPLHHVFETFDDAPIAAASIAQIHRAVLRRERAVVAVKVQRPHAAADFEQDLRLISRLLRTLHRLRVMRHLRWLDIAWEVRQIFREEIDYRTEAASIRRMRATLRRHGITVPRVFVRYSTRRILVMQYLDGVLMSEYIAAARDDPARLDHWRRANNVRPAAVGRALYLSMLRQLFEDNLFHGDLHPGNIVLLRDSGVGLIDFGTIGSLESGYLRTYRLFVRALAAQEFERAAHALLLLCTPLPAVDLDALTVELVRVMRAWYSRAQTRGLEYHERSIASNMTDLGRVLFTHRVWLSWAFLKINRTHLTLDASLMHLLPGANYPKLLRRYFGEALDRALLDMARPDTIKETLAAGVLGLQSGLQWLGERRAFDDVGRRRVADAIPLAPGPIAAAAGVVLAQTSALLAIAAGAAALAWLGGRPPEGLPAALDRVVAWIANLSLGALLVLVAALAYLHVVARAIRRELVHPRRDARGHRP